MSEPRTSPRTREPLRLDVSRTGGFAGVTISGSLNSQELDPAKAEELWRLVERAGLLDEPPPSSSRSSDPDRFEYEITLQSGDGAGRKFVFAEKGASDDLRELFRFLMVLLKETKEAGSRQ